MYQLRLNDGTVFSARFCAAQNGVLTMGIQGEYTFMQIAAIFADSTKTSRITFTYGGMQDVHLNFTDLVSVIGTNAAEYIISLRKETQQWA